MAKGKNKKLSKKGKLAKKQEKHPFLKKEWYSVIAPAALRESKSVGWTCCNKPTGTKVVSDFLKNRVAEMSYADLTDSAKDVSKRIKILIEDIQGSSCFTSFHSYKLSHEKVYAMLKKRQTLIEVITDVKANDGVIFRLMIAAVTNRRHGQLKLNSYAQSSKVKLLRKRLTGALTAHCAEMSSASLIHEVVSEALNTKLEKLAHEVIPGLKLQVHKLKIVKRGNVDMLKLTDQTVQAAKQATESDARRKENPNAQNLLAQ